ncbi:uncharacterized protein LOC119185076 [Rhipicephalus microplus]|uniref:uncharacterized protein LOC119185076 n=1 Tax=Rhipicephalus microplus TaxID=6941 RepID=UPI003F6A8285
MSRMNCCVVNCANSYEKCPPGTKFFRFPGRQCLVDQRERWIRNVRRVNANGTEWQPAKWSRVCSAHFVGGKSSTDPASPSYAPAIFPPTYCKTSAIAEDKRSRYERWTKRTRALFAISDPSSVSLHEDVGEDEPVDSSISSNDDCGVVESLPDVPPQCDENELSRHEDPRLLLSGDGTIGCMPRPCHSSKRDHDDIAAEAVYRSSLYLACQPGRAVETSRELACELHHVANKLVQAQVSTRHEASQANGEKVLSTSATQTDVQAVASRSLSFVAPKQSSSLVSAQSRLHSCQWCTYVTRHKSSMNRHLQKRHGERPLKCQFCPASFNHNSKLDVHVRTHTGERPFSCVQCNGSFFTKDQLKTLMRRHTGERPYSCAHCNASFIVKSALNQHIWSHTGERPHKCSQCTASFTQKRSLVHHILLHTGERPFFCAHCNASFSIKKYLDEHLRTHTGERPFSCVHCSASYCRKTSLIKHMRKHSEERPFSCAHCSASFVMKSYLNEHMRNHEGQRLFFCVHCDASFMLKKCLDKHIRIHTEECSFSCAHCNASFSAKGGLDKHMRIHTGERPFKCVQCSASFSQNSHLLTHNRVHTGEHAFSCFICNVSFFKKNDLMKHIRIHTGEHP